MVDHESHIDSIEQYQSHSAKSAPWDIFIKINMGSNRAGVELSAPRLKSLIKRAESSREVNIYGFYCHAGHSYGARTAEAAAKILNDEVRSALEAASMRKSQDPVVLSVGATPTVHVISMLDKSLRTQHKIELHGGKFNPHSPFTLTSNIHHPGNYPVNDLQQVATSLVSVNQQALRIVAEVCSIYVERNEAIINAGLIALARESGPMPGFARVVGAETWNVGRLSQEHGILVCSGDAGAQKVEDCFYVGQKLMLHVQHSCITAAAYGWYFVVDDDDIVRDIWYPWRGW